jgi:hypothetical protein
MNNLSKYSNCKEILYYEDEKGDWVSLWQFNDEGVVRAYKNGHYLGEDIKTPLWLDELPRFNEA